jgi:hypothetical protein
VERGKVVSRERKVKRRGEVWEWEGWLCCGMLNVAPKGAVNGRHHDVRDRVTVTIISTVVANLVSSSLIEQIINIVRH